MINRTKMPRQLRNKGGITNVISRKKYGIGSDLKDFARKLIPNELADVAVKVAPVVAPFYPGYAAIARGLGRFDQRGSISDALKQGAATYGFGKVAGKLGGAEGSEIGNVFGRQKYSMEGFRDKGLGRLFQEKQGVLTEDQMKRKRLADLENADSIKDTPKFMQKAADKVFGKVPLLDKLPPMVQQKLLVGGVTAGASALYSYFTGEFEPQEPGETMGEYMARRNKRVKEQMRGYMDSYYTPLRNPQYAAMSDDEKNNFIDGIVGQQNDAMMATGGRVGYQVGGISSANTLAENIARNRAAQSAFQQSIAPAQQRTRQKISRSDGLGDYVGGADLSGGTENINSPLNIAKAAASVPFNFIKGAIGNPLNPEALTQVSLTQAQKQRLNEIAKAKGTATGNIDYSDYGSPTPTFSGVKGMTPLDATLATTMGGTDFRTNPDGGIEFLGGKYDFNKDFFLTDFIDQGGISGAVARGVEGIGNLLTPSTAMAAEADKERQAEIEALDFENNPQNYQSNPDESGYKSLLSRLGQKDVDILVPGESFEDSQTRQKQQAMNTRQKINQEFQDYLDKQGYQKYLSDREIYQSAPAIMERENKLKEELNRLAALDTDVAEDFGFANILNDPNYRKEMTGYTVDRERGQTPVYRNLSPEALQEKLSGSLENVFNQYGVFNNQFRKDPLTSGQYLTLRNQLEDLKKYGNVDPKYSERIDYIMPESFSNIEDIRRRLDPNRARFNTRDPSKRFDYGDVEFKQGSGLTLPSEFYKDILDRSQGLPSQFQGYGKNLLKQLQAMKSGGRVGLMGGAMPTGIMRSNQAGVMERDYRDEGGFVPVGIKEKADDVPAMLSKNEFVFTADAVRGAGNGSIEKGAQKMYDTMKNLERRVV